MKARESSKIRGKNGGIRKGGSRVLKGSLTLLACYQQWHDWSAMQWSDVEH